MLFIFIISQYSIIIIIIYIEIDNISFFDKILVGLKNDNVVLKYLLIQQFDTESINIDIKNNNNTSSIINKYLSNTDKKEIYNKIIQISKGTLLYISYIIYHIYI